MKKTNFGFTIIELLVVIAIIAILAAIILINITGYINKGKDAAVKADLATLMTNAITYYEKNSTFQGVENDPDYKNAKAGAESPRMGYRVRVTCNDYSGNCTSEGATKWCASVLLKATNVYYCVDSSGAKKESGSENCLSGECRD